MKLLKVHSNGQGRFRFFFMSSPLFLCNDEDGVLRQLIRQEMDLSYFAHKIDLPQIYVPHIKLGFSHFLFLNSGTPLVLEGCNSMNCVA